MTKLHHLSSNSYLLLYFGLLSIANSYSVFEVKTILLTLLKNILQSGGIIGLGIKPMQTNIYTKLAGELDTIEADAYNSDEYWILRALTNGLSNPSSYINSRDKTFFKIRNILDYETST